MWLRFVARTIAYWPWVALPVFLVLFFGKIALNGANYSAHKKEFTEKCENNGGVVYWPKGVRGWPELKCVKREFFIEIGANDE